MFSHYLYQLQKGLTKTLNISPNNHILITTRHQQYFSFFLSFLISLIIGFCLLSNYKQLQKNTKQMSKKYFINNLDTAFGQALLSELVKEPVEEPVHMCTVKVPVDSKPNGIKKILKRQKPKLFKKKARQQCDIYIYNINQTQFQDIDFGINIVEKPFEQAKVFILISDIMVWSNSERKIKKNEPPPPPEGEQGNAEKVEGEQKAQQNQQKEAQQNKEDINLQEKPIQFTYFQDGDFKCRVPLEKYNYIKEIQDKVLNIKNQNLKIFVICPGIIYGCGEDSFYELFKAAWLQNPIQLPYLKDGKNKLPTIHLIDLVKFVIKVAQSPPQGSPYLLAVDETQDQSQKSIIEGISKGVGSGQTISVNESKLLQNPQKFLIDIDMRPSKILVGTAEQPVEFQWVARKGLKQNIKSVLVDFCKKQAHRPLKILLFQQQRQWRKQSKVQDIIKTFADYYRVPVLTIDKILADAKIDADQELIEDLKEQRENIAQYLLENQKRSLDQTMKVFYRAIRWRLSQNDCNNRGFILENFPQFVTQVQHIFSKLNPKKLKRKKPKKKKQQPKVQQSQKSLPQGQDQQDKPAQEVPPPQQAKEQEEEKQEENQQENQDGQGPKYQSYYPESVIRIKRMGKTQQNEVIDYFSDRGIQQLVYDTTSMRDLQIFESIRSYTQRNGRPNNYLIPEEELRQKYQTFTKSKNKQNLDNREKINNENKKKVQEAKNKRNQLAQKIYQIVRNQGQQEVKNMPFRNYLMEFVVPTLNEGLLEVSNIIPNDPVDLLAEYLYQKSYDI